jgi:hypothetical protein
VVYDFAQPFFVRTAEVPKSACDFLQHCTWSMLARRLEHIRPQDQIVSDFPRVFWTAAASPHGRLKAIRVRNPEAIDASPVAEQFNGLIPSP